MKHHVNISGISQKANTSAIMIVFHVHVNDRRVFCHSKHYMNLFLCERCVQACFTGKLSNKGT